MYGARQASRAADSRACWAASRSWANWDDLADGAPAAVRDLVDVDPDALRIAVAGFGVEDELGGIFDQAGLAAVAHRSGRDGDGEHEDRPIGGGAGAVDRPGRAFVDERPGRLTEELGVRRTLQRISATVSCSTSSVRAVGWGAPVAKPTVRRIVALLTDGGSVERLPDDPYRKRYRLTLRARVLGHEMATAAGFAAA
jgi:hypothetical protein